MSFLGAGQMVEVGSRRQARQEQPAATGLAALRPLGVREVQAEPARGVGDERGPVPREARGRGAVEGVDARPHSPHDVVGIPNAEQVPGPVLR